jgi:fructose-1,6-bisphosphatase/inositol monophosphatase family enzyme
MMCHLIDGAGVDVVLEMAGQAPHDFVAGAYIAQKAGASLCSLDGKAINMVDLLLRPANANSRVRYVLAATEQLAFQLVSEICNDMHAFQYSAVA